MNPYTYHHYNLNGMGASGVYSAKSDYPYPQIYSRQYEHYDRDAHSPSQDIGKNYGRGRKVLALYHLVLFH